MKNIVSWEGNHNANLPNTGISAWMTHGRAVGENAHWIASLSVYAPGFGLLDFKQIMGVQDDFGNFFEVKK